MKRLAWGENLSFHYVYFAKEFDNLKVWSLREQGIIAISVQTLFRRDNRQKTSFLATALQNAEVRTEVELVGHERFINLIFSSHESMSAMKCGAVVFIRGREFVGAAKFNCVEIMSFKQLCTHGTSKWHFQYPYNRWKLVWEKSKMTSFFHFIRSCCTIYFSAVVSLEKNSHQIFFQQLLLTSGPLYTSDCYEYWLLM